MAASNQGGDDDGMVSGINVTPFVDICLVLLVVFMLTAKIMVSQSIPLDLPKAAKGQDVQLQFGVELYANGELKVNGTKLAGDDAILALAKEQLAKSADLRAVIRADTTVPHGRVIRVLDLLKQGGVSKIAFGVSPIPAEPGAVPAPAPAKP